MLTISEIEFKLKDPLELYKPFVRWWWFGSAVSKTGIRRQMEEMKKQSIAGVEIQPTYSALKGCSISGIKNLTWLSEKWLEMLQFAVETGKELGIQVDLTFGTGWPFGGPHVSEHHASMRLTSVSGLQALPYLLSKKTRKKPKIEFSVKHLLKKTYYFSEKTGQRVKRANPGAEGWVIDHLSREAFDEYADGILTPLKRHFGDKLGEFFGAFFCDSWEVTREIGAGNLMKYSC